MKSIEQLEAIYEKEMQISDQHKQKAMDIRKQIKMQTEKTVLQKINSLNMTGTEYDKFLKLLGNGKKSVIEAANIVLQIDAGSEKAEGASGKEAIQNADREAEKED
ncbi:MAG: hypothetical protein HFI48_16690 [Lachnospiraceae bacterium]|nr:hypothetical protein [Lachnospiraceae bacterium]